MKALLRLTQFMIWLAGSIVSATLAHAEDPHVQWQGWADNYPSWVAPIEPFQVIGNIYYVGTEGLAVYLITSKEGHILLDGGMPQSANGILERVEQLGFEVDDIKVLLNSHAHFDHSGGLAEIKRRTGARLIASNADKEWLESGLYPGSENKAYAAPPVDVDETVDDGETITLGKIKLTANITPGHTPGCTSWSMDVSHADEDYDTLFFCSATVAGNRLVGPPQYPGIVEDYRHTFKITKPWRPDVFLSNHPGFFNMSEKLAARKEGDELAFVDRTGFPAMMKQLESAFEGALVKQQAELPQL